METCWPKLNVDVSANLTASTGRVHLCPSIASVMLLLGHGSIRRVQQMRLEAYSTTTILSIEALLASILFSLRW